MVTHSEVRNLLEVTCTSNLEVVQTVVIFLFKHVLPCSFPGTFQQLSFVFSVLLFRTIIKDDWMYRMLIDILRIFQYHKSTSNKMHNGHTSTSSTVLFQKICNIQANICFHKSIMNMSLIFKLYNDDMIAVIFTSRISKY